MNLSKYFFLDIHCWSCDIEHVLCIKVINARGLPAFPNVKDDNFKRKLFSSDATLNDSYAARFLFPKKSVTKTSSV